MGGRKAEIGSLEISLLVDIFYEEWKVEETKLIASFTEDDNNKTIHGFEINEFCSTTKENFNAFPRARPAWRSDSRLPRHADRCAAQ